MQKTDTYTYLVKFLESYYPVSDHFHYQLDDFDYFIYIIKTVIPFVCDLKK